MKQVSRNRQHKAEQEQDETQAKEVRDEQLAKETEDLLAEVDCCLAEAVADQDEKAKAKAEWEKNNADYFDGKIDSKEFFYNRNVWTEKYRYVIPMKRDCCGQIVPDFGDE